jgi:CubicO group peptidase (beta-lactamase class C family)
MNTVFFAAPRPYRRAPCPILCGLLVLVSIGPSSTIAQTGAAFQQQLDSIAGARVRENRAVGIVAAVVKGNDTLLLKAYGKAVVESDSAATVDTVFQLGSDTKQFTAAAILQLRDQGKLTLDDDITKWLPDFETHGNKVTLRHLLGHTSGIAELGGMQELRAMQLMRNPTATRDDVYKVINRYPFMFPTGRWRSTATPTSGCWVSSSRRRAG